MVRRPVEVWNSSRLEPLPPLMLPAGVLEYGLAPNASSLISISSYRRRVREREETNYEAKRGTTTLGCGSCGDFEAFLRNGDDAPAPEPYLPPERPSARDPSSVCGQRPCSGMVVYDPLMQVKKKKKTLRLLCYMIP